MTKGVRPKVLFSRAIDILTYGNLDGQTEVQRLLDGLENRKKAEEKSAENIIEVRKQAAVREFTQMILRNILERNYGVLDKKRRECWVGICRYITY